MPPRQDSVRLPMMQPIRRPSIIDQAELELRNAIFVGDLRPGDTIPEVQVSKQMGISRSSLREACQRLVRDGLLTQIPGRGLFVTRMDAETMSDFIDYRLGIEMQVASIVADRIRALRANDEDSSADQLLAPLRATLERTRRALEAEEVIEAGNATGDFAVDDVDQVSNVLYALGLGGLQLARLGVMVREETPGVPVIASLDAQRVKAQLVGSTLALVRRADA